MANTIDELKEVPPHINDIFGEPPILNTERRDIYESLLLDIANQIRPQKALEWSWVKDLADLIWEIRRYRWQITLILEAASKPALKALLKSTEVATFSYKFLAEREEEESFADKLFGSSEEQSEVYAKLAKYSIDSESIAAQALLMRGKEIRALEDLIGRAERRRYYVLREIAFYRETLAELLDLHTQKLIDEKPDLKEVA
jgi:hypothetical protein